MVRARVWSTTDHSRGRRGEITVDPGFFRGRPDTPAKIYDPDLVPALAATIRILLELNPHSAAVVAAPVRNPSTLELFIAACGASQGGHFLCPV